MMMMTTTTILEHETNARFAPMKLMNRRVEITQLSSAAMPIHGETPSVLLIPSLLPLLLIIREFYYYVFCDVNENKR